MVQLIRRSFKHYSSKDGNGGMWYHCLINVEKLKALQMNTSVTKKLKHFVVQYILNKKVPDHFFTEDAERCCTADVVDCITDERPSRYKRIIEEALENRGDRQAHYVVQKALVESPETEYVIAECPVWLPEGRRVGHIDVIGMLEGNPSLLIADFKPLCSDTDENPSGQLSMYKMILAQMLNIPLKEVMCEWFDNVVEVIVV